MSGLDFVLEEDGFKVVPLRHAATTLKGRFAGRVAHAVSLTAMDEAIASEAASRHREPAKSRVEFVAVSNEQAAPLGPCKAKGYSGRSLISS